MNSTLYHRLIRKPLTAIKFLIVNNQWTIRTSAISSSTIEERKIRVKDVEINYAKTGAGDHPVLLLPGVMGTIWTDFKPQIEALDKKKLTIIAWDPPGYGKSRPPDREFPSDFYHKDADYATELMTNLGYSKFSVIGWSGGGITSLIMAGNNPEIVRKMVVYGAPSYIVPEGAKIFASMRNIDVLSEHIKAPLIAVYGEKYFRDKWAAWSDAIVNIYEKNNGDICKKSVDKIQCPTLIIHGKKDRMVDSEQAEYLKKHILNSRYKK